MGMPSRAHALAAGLQVEGTAHVSAMCQPPPGNVMPQVPIALYPAHPAPVEVKVHGNGAAHAKDGARGAQGQVGAAVEGGHGARHRRHKVHDQHAPRAAAKKRREAGVGG